MTQVTCNTSEYSVPHLAGDACLVVMHAPLRRLLGARVSLSRGEAVLGRDPGCDLVLDVSDVSRVYVDAILALPAFVEWRTAALKEPWVMRHNEPDWPLVRGV